MKKYVVAITAIVGLSAAPAFAGSSFHFGIYSPAPVYYAPAPVAYAPVMPMAYVNPVPVYAPVYRGHHRHRHGAYYAQPGYQMSYYDDHGRGRGNGRWR